MYLLLLDRLAPRPHNNLVMKRFYNNWLTRITIGFAALTSMRLISTVLHMTTLEKLYKPRDFRKTSHLNLSQEILDGLPRFSQAVTGQRMDPINMIVVGTENGIKRAFEKAGWSPANPATPIHMALASISTLFKRSHKTGPFTPHFIGFGLQDLSFQKLTAKKSFSQRHHIRLWRTTKVLPKDQQVWIAAASYDTSLRLDWLPPFVHHHINPDLDEERDLIALELIKYGSLMVGNHQMIEPIEPSKPSKNATGARYFTDGKAIIIEIV